MKIKEYNQMMAYLTRPSTPLEKKISEEKIKKNKPRKIIVLIDLKFLSEKRPIKGSRNASKIRTRKIISPAKMRIVVTDDFGGPDS